MASKRDKDRTGKKGKAQKETPTGKLSRSERYDFSYTQNREISWLRFDNRVLDEAYDETVPLFERLKFAAIFQSNLDEFFMIRIGGLSDLATLKHQPVDNKSNLTPREQIELVFQTLPPLVKRQNDIVTTIESALEAHGIYRLSADELAGDERTFVERYFQRYVSPVISPLVIDPRHPFPNLHNGTLYLLCALDGADASDEENLLGLIEVPTSMSRVVPLPSEDGTYRCILLEDVILACLGSCFGTYTPLDRAVVRVTRNADIDPDGEGVEEDEDYRQHMKKILKKRLRLQPVALQVEGQLEATTLKRIRKSLGLAQRAVLTYTTPLDLDYVYSIEGHLPEQAKSELLCPPFRPQQSPLIDTGRSMREQILEGDKLLFYPYESMNPLLDLMHEAAFDPECISMRITLYRVAKQSRLCEALIDAAENGKEVTVLMELRARFDEQNNIDWAERLEEAGCTVIYGTEGFKVHSKICQLTYREGMALTRITLLGTGNFNEKTARLYSDFMLMTAHPGIGEDANVFFRNLTLGNLRGDYRYLGVAPVGLKPLILNGLNREIERARAGEPARVFFKMNSLTDREIIDKVAEASQAGVTVNMIIRGISCLLPGVAGKTENVHIRSIVGRFLEHARVYAFGVDSDIVYLSSADMMTRNTEHRVEIAYPVLDPACRRLVEDYMQAQLRDNVKARALSSTGEWERVARGAGEEDFNAQEFLLEQAYERAAHPKRARAAILGAGVDAEPEADTGEDSESGKAETSDGAVEEAAGAEEDASAISQEAADEAARAALETALAETEARARAAKASRYENTAEGEAASVAAGAAMAAASEPAAVPPAATTATGSAPAGAAAREGEASVTARIIEPANDAQAPEATGVGNTLHAGPVESVRAPSSTGATASENGQASPSTSSEATANAVPGTSKTLAKRRAGRLRTGFALIGLGFKTLLFGPNNQKRG